MSQLAKEVAGRWCPQDYIWKKGDRFIDALRPSVEPDGLDSPESVMDHRRHHLSRVRELFETLDLFIFTFGLTETWEHKESGTVYPTAPGPVAGEFDESSHTFLNIPFSEVLADFNEFQETLLAIRNGRPFKVLLTVSPVPLTATASGSHVLVSNTYSKSVLRAVAGQLSGTQDHIDYFPSYEIVTNPRFESASFLDNLRSVRPEVIEAVIHHFFQEHSPISSPVVAQHSASKQDIDVQCEEALLEAFQQRRETTPSTPVAVSRFVEVIGNSHLAGFKHACEESSILSHYFYPSNWFVDDQHYWRRDHSLPVSMSDIHHDYLSMLVFPESSDVRRGIIFVGLGLMGDGVIRCIGSLKAGFTHKNGKIVAGKEISPSIPIVTSIQQIQQTTIRNYKENIVFAKMMLDQIRKTSQDVALRWICSPMPSERCARYRFGADYVDSLAQRIYNQAYRQLMFEILGDEIRSGIILLQPESTISENGFTKDAFQAQEPVYGIHCSSELYKTYLNKLS